MSINGGRIYKIVSDKTDKIYIGSTAKSLEERLETHEHFYEKWINRNFRRKYCTSFEILKYGEYNIILIEELKDCYSYEDLRKREGYYQINNFFICVNTNIAGGRDKNVNIDENELYPCYCDKEIQINLKTRYKHIKSQKHKKKIKENHLEMIKSNPKFEVIEELIIKL